MSVSDIFLSFAAKIRARLTNINTALKEKGQAEANTLDDVPAKIRAIETGITPAGTKTITSNGTHDVTAYASASVNVPVPSGYVKPSGNKSITSNGTGIDVKNYATVSVNVPIPNGYVLPKYTITTNSTQINPGTDHAFLPGTYLPNGYTISANEGGGGYAGESDMAIRDGATIIKFNCDQNSELIGFAVVSNGMEESDDRDFENIISLVYSQNGYEYNYIFAVRDSDGEVYTYRSDYDFSYTINNGIITITIESEFYRFMGGYDYYFMPFYA